MEETKLEKKIANPMAEKGQFVLAFGVISLMLYIAGLPMFLLFFVGALSFLIWKVFAFEGKNETRRIFEFFLIANEILRDDDRKWYGFEIQEAIHRGEGIVRSMSVAPPLVHYGLGALFQKIGDHASAVKNLSFALEEVNELAIAFPSRDLREYVRMLRKIERSPSEAPLTSSAIRSLERSRKNRGEGLLESSRSELSKAVDVLPEQEKILESIVDDPQGIAAENGYADSDRPGLENWQLSKLSRDARFISSQKPDNRPTKAVRSNPQSAERQSISEVLHDIYDEAV